MIVDRSCDKFNVCDCGYTPKSFSIGYGQTPYVLQCKCGKKLYDAKCKITGNYFNLISYWNDYLSVNSIAKILKDKLDFIKEKKREQNYAMQKAKEYQYYWYKGKGETLIQEW